MEKYRCLLLIELAKQILIIKKDKGTVKISKNKQVDK